MPYGFLHQGYAFGLQFISDFNQDVLVGRIPAPDLKTAMNEVAAITAHDDKPPTSGTFYSHVTAAALFQPCLAIQTDCGNSPGNTPVAPSIRDTQSFLRTSEFTASRAEAAGKAVNRVTADENNYDTVPISPQTFDNGQPITPGLTFDLSSADMTSEIRQDIENGSFLVWHSDHGATNGVGWYEPPFVEYGDVNGLSDGTALPVVWSSDCDSGKFDAPAWSAAAARSA